MQFQLVFIFFFFFFFVWIPACLTQILKLGECFRFLLFTKQATRSCFWLYRYWERGCHGALDALKGGFTRVVPKQTAAATQLPRQLLRDECNYTLKKIMFFSWFGVPKGDTSQVPETTRIFLFFKATKKNLQKSDYMQCSVGTYLLQRIISMAIYLHRAMKNVFAYRII